MITKIDSHKFQWIFVIFFTHFFSSKFKNPEFSFISVAQHLVVFFTQENKYGTLSSETSGKLLSKGKTIGDQITYEQYGKKYKAEILFIGKYM